MTAGGTSHHVHHVDIEVAAVGISGIVSQGDPLEAVDPAKLLRNPAAPADHESLRAFDRGAKRRAFSSSWIVLLELPAAPRLGSDLSLPQQAPKKLTRSWATSARRPMKRAG